MELVDLRAGRAVVVALLLGLVGLRFDLGLLEIGLRTRNLGALADRRVDRLIHIGRQVHAAEGERRVDEVVPAEHRPHLFAEALVDVGGEVGQRVGVCRSRLRVRVDRESTGWLQILTLDLAHLLAEDGLHDVAQGEPEHGLPAVVAFMRRLGAVTPRERARAELVVEVLQRVLIGVEREVERTVHPDVHTVCGADVDLLVRVAPAVPADLEVALTGGVLVVGRPEPGVDVAGVGLDDDTDGVVVEPSAVADDVDLTTRCLAEAGHGPQCGDDAQDEDDDRQNCDHLLHGTTSVVLGGIIV